MKTNSLIVRIFAGFAMTLLLGAGYAGATAPVQDTLPAVNWQTASVESGELSYVVNPQFYSASTNVRSHLRSTFVSGAYKLNIDMSFSQSVQVGDTSGNGVEVVVESDPLVLSSGDFTSVSPNGEVVLDSLNTSKATIKMIYSWSDRQYRLGVRPLTGGGLEFYASNNDTGNTKVLARIYANEPEVWTMDSSIMPQTDFVISPAATNCTSIPKATFQILEVKLGSSLLMADETTVYPSSYSFACPGKQIISYHGGLYRFSRGSYIENISNLVSGKNILIGSGGYRNAYYNSPNPTVDLVIMQGSDPVVAGVTSLLNSNDWANFRSESDEAGGVLVTGFASLPGMAEGARMFVPYTAGQNQLLFCPDATSLTAATPTCTSLAVFEQTAEGQKFVSSNGRIYWSLPLRGGAFKQTTGYKPGGAPGSETSGSTGDGNSDSENGTNGGSDGPTPPPVVTGILGTSSTFNETSSSTDSNTGKPNTSQVLGASAVLSATGTSTVGVVAGVVIILLGYLRLNRRSKYHL